MLFQPVVEPDLPGVLITKNPHDGHSFSSLNIPLLTGYTLNEGVLRSACKLFMN